MSTPPSDEPAGHDLRRSSSLVAAGILLSRVAGLIREAATAFLLGIGVGADAFRAALRIPNLLQNLLGEGVLSASFVPAYSRLLAEGKDEEAGRLAGAVAGLLLAVVGVIVVGGVVFAGPIVRVLTPGTAFAPGTDRYELTVQLVRIVTPGVGFLVLSAWCLGILNSHRKFFLSYVAPVVWNAAIIIALVSAALVTTSELDRAQALAWGALVGSLLQLLVQLGPVRRHARGLRLAVSLAVPGVRDVVRRFGQVLAGRGGVQLGSYVDLMIASLLAAGALSALTYAQVLYLLPISLFGMSVAAAELPGLSTMDHHDRLGVRDRLEVGLHRVAFFVLPCVVVFTVLGDRVVALIYLGGRFGPDDAAQVRWILAAYALGLLASTSSRLLQSSLYGGGDTRSPAIYAVLRVSLSTVVGVALMLPLDQVEATAAGLRALEGAAAAGADDAVTSNAFRLGAAGLALGAAVGAWFELWLLRVRVGVVFARPRLVGSHLGQLLTATAVAGVVAAGTRWAMGLVDWAPRLESLVSLGAVGVCYLGVAYVLRVPEAHHLVRSVTRRLAS